MEPVYVAKVVRVVSQATLGAYLWIIVLIFLSRTQT